MSSPAQRFRGKSELGVCVFLAGLGALVLWDASQTSRNLVQRGPVGPTAIPIGIGIALIVLALLLARDVLRGGHGESETGEDVDLSHPSDWRTVLLLIAAWLVNAAVRGDANSAFGLSFLSYFVFARELGIGLPAGILEGII